MTGPEHYELAEQLLTGVNDYDHPYLNDETALAVAQVHATLALAAATGLADRVEDWHQWERVAGTGYRGRPQADAGAPS